MLHYMTLQPKPFEMIAEGEKIYELRLWDAKRQLLNENDIIVFTNANNDQETIRTQVLRLHRFENFAQLYDTLPLLKCGYTPQELDTADPADMAQYYSPEEQAQYGVVAIELKLITGERDPQLVQMGHYLSKLLRHKPALAGITLDAHGWADVTALLEGMNKKCTITREQLETIVATDDKLRFSFDATHTKLRANQGHAVAVDVELEELAPPRYLWHGTATRFADSIARNGIHSGKRLYVHLSSDWQSACQVGSRHGQPLVYRVDTYQMFRDGHRFYRSANRVWMTRYVPACYLQVHPAP